MPTTKLFGVGAIACDVILGVPFYPEEDSKLRATSCTKRRGGNIGNTFEVLQQLLPHAEQRSSDAVHTELVLVAALPSRNSSSTEFVIASFHGGEPSMSKNAHSALAPVNMEHCLYRPDQSEPVTSYIISSKAAQSRTIVNHNQMPEMTFAEFSDVTHGLIQPLLASSSESGDCFWFHFEGRIPETTLKCIMHLRGNAELVRDQRAFQSHPRLKISVEIEKPGRPGLKELAEAADVIFFSRSWAESEGYRSAEECVRDQAETLRAATRVPYRPKWRLVVCTWGSKGACGLVYDYGQSAKSGGFSQLVVHSPAYELADATIVDTTGAGDTFIAGVLCQVLDEDPIANFSGLSHSRLKETLDHANRLAGCKILQHGFSDLQSAGQG